jgi:hypothetical protein
VSADVENAALELGSRPTGVWGVPSIVKVTVPVGVPAPGAFTETFEVNVTVVPSMLGDPDDMSVVVVEAWVTPAIVVPLLAK